MTAAAPPESPAILPPTPPVFRPHLDEVTPPVESPRIVDPSQIGGRSEAAIAQEDNEVNPDEVYSAEEPPIEHTEPIPEAVEPAPANARTRTQTSYRNARKIDAY
jgi:hypothetical protein